MNRQWNLDREPTRADRIAGIVGASVLLIFGLAMLWLTLFVRPVWQLALGSGILSAFALFMLYRVSFTAAKRLQPRAKVFLGSLIGLSGFGMVLLGFAVPGLANRPTWVGLGLLGLSGGLLNVFRPNK